MGFPRDESGVPPGRGTPLLPQASICSFRASSAPVPKLLRECRRRFRGRPDGVLRRCRQHAVMEKTLAEKIAWRRHGVRRHYIGTLVASSDGICLTGSDPVSGVEVVLSIPLTEIENVRVAGPGDELLAGERCVVLELAESESIYLRDVGTGPLHIHVLARSLGALTQARPLVAQGGAR